jgi:uncharacterized delta-60 repeat protein
MRAALAGALAVLLTLAGVALARPGQLDMHFGGDGRIVDRAPLGSAANAVAILPGGGIIAAGRDEEQASMLVTRTTPDGRFDRRFGRRGRVVVRFPFEDATATDVALAPHGRIVVAGVTETGHMAVVRLARTGVPDETFGPGGRRRGPVCCQEGDTAPAVRVVVQPDGAVVAAAETRSAVRTRFVSGVEVVRWRARGGVDRRFGPGGVVFVRSRADFGGPGALLLARAGAVTVVTAGTAFPVKAPRSCFLEITDVSRSGRLRAKAVARVRSPCPFGFAVSGAARMPAGRIGVLLDIRSPPRGANIRVLRRDGSVVRSFGKAGVVELSGLLGAAVAAGPRGRLVVAGIDSAGHAVVARLTPRGRLDGSFGTGGLATFGFIGSNRSDARAVAVAGHRIVVAGVGADALAELREDLGARRLGIAVLNG